MMSDDLKVVTFRHSSEGGLEADINRWLEENKVEVVDIKYQIASSGGDNYHRYLFSAMIIYKQPK